MEEIVEYCAGLDVHRDTVVATVRRPAPGGKRETETRTFPTDTRGLLAWVVGWLSSRSPGPGWNQRVCIGSRCFISWRIASRKCGC
jgi:hypothetical protein